MKKLKRINTLFYIAGIYFSLGFTASFLLPHIALPCQAVNLISLLFESVFVALFGQW